MSTSALNVWKQVGLGLILLVLIMTPAYSATFTQDLSVQPSTSGDVILMFKAIPTVPGGVGVVYDVYRVTSLVPPGSFGPADQIASGVASGAPTVILINTQSQFTNAPFGTNTTSDGQPYYYQVRAQDVDGSSVRIPGSIAQSSTGAGVADVDSPDDLRNDAPEFVALSQAIVPCATLQVVLPADTVLNMDSPLQAGTIGQTASPTEEYRFRIAWFKKKQSTLMTTIASLPVESGSEEVIAGPFETYDIGETDMIRDCTGMESGTAYSYFVQVIDTVGNRNGTSASNLDAGHTKVMVTAVAPLTSSGTTVINASGQLCSGTILAWVGNPNSLTTDPANLVPGRFRIYAASRNTPILTSLDVSTATIIGELTVGEGIGGASTAFSFTHTAGNVALPRISQATYAYMVVAIDEFGRTGPIGEGEVVFAADTVAPATNFIFDPIDGATVSGTIPVQATVQDNECGGSGIDRVDFYITDATGTETLIASDDTDHPEAATMSITAAVSLDTTVYPDGPGYVLSATAVDFGGNAAPSTNDPTVTIDNTVPQVKIQAPPTGSYVNNVVILWGTASDPSGITNVSLVANTSIGPIVGSVVGTTAWTATMDLSSVPSEEAITVDATATDGIGNMGSELAFPLVTDSTGPEITGFTCPEWVSAASALLGIQVSATATDPDAVPAPAQSGVNNVTLEAAGADAPDVVVGGNPNTHIFTFSGVTPVELATLYFTASADDNALDQRGIAGMLTANPSRPNIGAASTCGATFDLTGPVCTIISPASGFISTTATPFAITGTAQDPLSGLQYLYAVITPIDNPGNVFGAATFFFTPGANNEPWNFNIDPGQDGRFLVTIVFVDMVGNMASCDLVVYRDSLPPIAEVDPTIDGLDVCTSIVLSGTAGDVFGVIDGVTVVAREWTGGVTFAASDEYAANIVGTTSEVTWWLNYVINAGLPDGATIEFVAYASTLVPTETGPTSATRTVTVDITPPVSQILGAAPVDGPFSMGVDPTILYMCASTLQVAGTAEDFGGAIVGPDGVLRVEAFYQVATGADGTMQAAYSNVTGNWTALLNISGIPSGATFKLGSQAQDAATSCQTLEAPNIFDATLVMDCVAPDISALTPLDGVCLPGTAFPFAYSVQLDEMPLPFHVGLASAEFFVDGGLVDTDVTVALTSSAVATGSIALLPDGTHTISVIAYDLLGNASTFGPETFTIDSIPPVVAYTLPPGYANTVNVSCALAGTALDVGCGVVDATLTYTNTPADTVVSVSPAADGTWDAVAAINAAFADGTVWQATFEATDGAGNTTTLVRTFTVDTEPPGTLALTLTAPGCYNGPLVFQAHVSDSSAGVPASLGYADSGIRSATFYTVVDAVRVDLATVPLDPPLTGLILANAPFNPQDFTIYGLDPGETFQVGWEFADGPCDISNIATVESALLTWDPTPPNVQITELVWPGGGTTEVIPGGPFFISCASEPFDIRGIADDACGVSAVEVFYSSDTTDPVNDMSLGMATVDVMGGTFELLGAAVPPIEQGLGRLWAIATDDIPTPTNGTPNTNARVDVVDASGVVIFVDTLPPTVQAASAMPFAATSASLREITITAVVCDDGIGLDANGPFALIPGGRTAVSTDVGKRVPPTGTSGTTLSKVAVPYLGAITTMSLDVNITHSYRGDLRITLISPGGTSTVVKTELISDSVDDVVATYDVTGAFGGGQPHGVWTLMVQDVYGGDSGTLNSWQLNITGSAAAQGVTLDPDYQVLAGGNPNPAPMAANFVALDGICATYTLTFNLPALLPVEGYIPVDVFASDLGGCTDTLNVTNADGFILMIDDTAPAPNLPGADPLAIDPANFNYPADDTIAQLGGSGGPFRWDYLDPLTWTDNELRAPAAWDQTALNPAPVRMAASPALTLAGKLMIAGQATDNSGVVQSGVDGLKMFWTFGNPTTPPDPADFTNQVPAVLAQLGPQNSNAPTMYSLYFDASSIVGTYYLKTLTTDYAGNVLDPIFGPFLGVDVQAPEAITWLRARTQGGTSDVLLDWHLGGHAPDNVGTVGYEIYRTRTAVQDLFGLTPSDFDLINIISATDELTGQDVFTYLDAIPGAGTYGYYIVGFDAAGNGAFNSPIPGNPSNRVAAAKNDIVDPLPVNNMRAVGHQPDSSIRLSWSIPDDPLTFAPFDGDNVGISQFKIYRKEQQVPLVDDDPDDDDGDLVQENLVGLLVNNYLPTEIVEEHASIVDGSSNLLVVLSPPVDATSVTRVFNRRTGATYHVAAVTDRTIWIQGTPNIPLPETTDVVLVDYQTFDRVFWDATGVPDKSFAYAVIAQDAAGNNSDISGLAEDSTSTVIDTRPPEAITALAVTDADILTSTMTLEWPTTPYDDTAVMAYNILGSTAPIFDINNPSKDVRILQMAGMPPMYMAPSATESATFFLPINFPVDLYSITVTDLTNGRIIPRFGPGTPPVNTAVDPYWTADLLDPMFPQVVVRNIPAVFADDPTDDARLFPANLELSYFDRTKILAARNVAKGGGLGNMVNFFPPGSPEVYREQLSFDFDPYIAWGTDTCLEGKTIYFVVMAVDPWGNQAPISNIATGLVPMVEPLMPIAWIDEVTPEKFYLPNLIVGGEDVVYATLTDPLGRDHDVVAIEVYSEDPGELSFVNSATTTNASGWYVIPVGDNLYPKLFVVAVDCAGNRSEAVVLFNDIVAPPMPTVDRVVFNPAPSADNFYGYASPDTVQVHLYNDASLSDLVAVAIPSPTGEWIFTIPDVTPEFVFITALDHAGNESLMAVVAVVPDSPVVVTAPRVLEVPPLRTRYIIDAGIYVTTGGDDRIMGTVSDPDVKRVNVYADEALLDLEFSVVPSATGWFDIPVGDNYLPVYYVTAVDSANHESESVRLWNDIVPPPVPQISRIVYEASPTMDLVEGYTSLDTVAINLYNDPQLIELIGSFAVVPGASGAFSILVANITPEYVFIAALDSVSNESDPAIESVIPDPPIVFTDPRVEENPPLRTRYLVDAGVEVTTGGPDFIRGYVTDPEVVQVQVYRDDELDSLAFWGTPDALGNFNIAIGDNVLPVAYVVAIDSASHRSPAVRLENDILAPPMPVVEQIIYHPAPQPDIVRGWTSPDTVTIDLYSDVQLYNLLGSYAVTPGASGEFQIMIADITPEFVFVAALDSVSNESAPAVEPVIPDPPIVFTDPRVHETEPLRTRYIVDAGIEVTTGGPDYVEGTVSDPQVVQVQVYRDDELDSLAYWGTPSATGYFKILIGDNVLPLAYVVAIDGASHRSPFVRLENDIVAPPTPLIDQIIFNPTPEADIVRGWTSPDTVTIDLYSDVQLYNLLGSYAVTPGASGEFQISIADITPEFVFATALDSVSNESSPAVEPVIPDPPIVYLLENPPIRFRCGALEGDDDYVIGYTNDPQVVRIEIYKNSDLESGDLIASQTLVGTNQFKISIGDNLYNEVFVVAVDSVNHRSPAVRLHNDIIAPPVLDGITLELYEGNNPDYIPPRPDLVRGFSTPDTTLVSVYKDAELSECVGEAVPVDGKWTVTVTEDVVWDFIFVTMHDGQIDVEGDGIRHPGNESFDYFNEDVPVERRAARIRVPNSPPIIYDVVVNQNVPGNPDTIKVHAQRGIDFGSDPDTEVEVRIFSMLTEGTPEVVTPFATSITDVRDMDSDLASNIYLVTGTQVLQLTQDGRTRVFFESAGVLPRTIRFDHRNTGLLLLGTADGSIHVIDPSGFTPGTPLAAGDSVAAFSTGITGDDLVGPVLDPANSSAATLRLVFADRGAGDVYEVNYNVVGTSFGAQGTRVAGMFDSPQSLAFDLTGNLFVGEIRNGGGMANPGQDRLVRIRPNGTMTVMATGLTVPTGLAVDMAGDLYVNQLTQRNIGLRGELLVMRPFKEEVKATLLRSVHTTFEGTPLRPAIDPAGRMYFGSRTGAVVSYVYQGVMSAAFPMGVDSGADGVPDRFTPPITPVQSTLSEVGPDGYVTFTIGDNEHSHLAVIAVRRGGFSTGVPWIVSNDIVEPQPPVAQATDATPPLQDSVTGYAERKSTVVVYGDPYGTNDLRSYWVGASGEFKQLFLGNNYLPDYWIAAIDAAGNRSVLNMLNTDITIDVPRLDKITVICNVPGNDDLVVGDPFAVEGLAWVRIYSNPELTHLVGSPSQAAADGSFTYNIGDNEVADMWLIAVDSSGNISQPIRLLNDIVGPALNADNIQVLAYEVGAQDFIIGHAGAVEGGAKVEAYLDSALTMPAPDPMAMASAAGAFGTLNMGNDTSPIIEMIGTEPFLSPRRSFFLRAFDECGNVGPVLELDNPYIPGQSPVDIAKIIVHSREQLLHDSVEGIYNAVEPMALVEVFFDINFTQPVESPAGVAAATSADQYGQFGPIDLGDDLAAAFFLKVTDAYGNVSPPVKIYNPFVPGISEVDTNRIHVFSNQNGVDDFVIGVAGAVEPNAHVAIFFDPDFTTMVPGAEEEADEFGAFGPINLGDDLAAEFWLRSIDVLGHVSSPIRLFNPAVENPVDLDHTLIEMISNEELVDDLIFGKSGAVEARGVVLVFTNIADAIAIDEDPVTHVVSENVPDIMDRAYRVALANDFGGFGPINVGDDVSTEYYIRVIDETKHISSPLLLRNPLVPGVVDVDPFRIRVVANEQGLDDFIVGDTGAVEPFSLVAVFTEDFTISATATAVRTGTVDEFGRFTINIGDDEFRTGDELETELFLMFTDPVGHESPSYRVVNPFILGTQRPDVLRIRMISNPQGIDDLVVGVDGAVEPNAEVRIYTDPGLANLVATAQADMWGAFGPVNVGDDISQVFYVVAVDELGNQSSALRLDNPIVYTNPDPSSFGFAVLDGFGGVHLRNVYSSLNDLAHAPVGVDYMIPQFMKMAPVKDGFFALRGDGVVEAFANAPLVDQITMPNYPHLFTGDFTRAVDIEAYEPTPGNPTGMYVVDGYGQVWTVRVYGVSGSLPTLSSSAIYGSRDARAMELVLSNSGTPIGTLVMNADGNITARGSSNFSSAVSNALGTNLLADGDAVDFEVVRDSGNTITGLLVLGSNGDVVSIGSAPDLPTRPRYTSSLARDIELDPSGRGYYILDGLGGITTVGDITPLADPPYFGFDIARDLDIIFAKDGSYSPTPYPEDEE